MKSALSIFFVFVILLLILLICVSCSSQKYVASKQSDVFHKTSCKYADNIIKSNREYFGSSQAAIEAGKRPCSYCKPYVGNSEIEGRTAAYISCVIVVVVSVYFFVLRQKEAEDKSPSKKAQRIFVYSLALILYLAVVCFASINYGFLSVLRIVWMVIGIIGLLVFIIGHFVKYETVSDYLGPLLLKIILFAIISIPILILVLRNFR